MSRRGGNRMIPSDPIDELYLRVSELEKEIKRVRNNTRPTIPLYSSAAFPDESINGQIAIDTTTGNVWSYYNGSWYNSGGGGGVIQIQDEGTDLTLRDTLNFTGDGVYAYDDGSGKTNVVIAGPGTPGIHYGTNTGSYLSIEANTNPSIGQVINLHDTYGATDSHGINISSDWGAIGIISGLEIDIVGTDRGGTDHGRGLVAMHSYSEALNTGIKIWMEHAGSPSSIFGGNHHIIIARTSSYGDVPGDVLMRIECNADGTGVMYRIKTGASWVADL